MVTPSPTCAPGHATAYRRATPRLPTLFTDRHHPPSISVWIEALTHPDVRIRTVSPVYSKIHSEFSEAMSNCRTLTDFLEHMQRFAPSRLDGVWVKPEGRSATGDQCANRIL